MTRTQTHHTSEKIEFAQIVTSLATGEKIVEILQIEAPMEGDHQLEKEVNVEL